MCLQGTADLLSFKSMGSHCGEGESLFILFLFDTYVCNT